LLIKFRGWGAAGHVQGFIPSLLGSIGPYKFNWAGWVLYFNFESKSALVSLGMDVWMFLEGRMVGYFPPSSLLCLPHFSPYLFLPSQKETSGNAMTVKKVPIKLNISREDLLQTGYNHKRNSWSEEEDKKLMKLVQTENHNWELIGKKMENRNSKMCYSRYRRLGYDTKKRWTKEEEKVIMDLIEKQGMNWKIIA
jgi:hypothetical protein